MKTYTIFWKYGLKEQAEGDSLEDALDNLDVSPVELKHMSFYVKGQKADKYHFEDGQWLDSATKNPIR